jgi:predicted Zn-dependent protease
MKQGLADRKIWSRLVVAGLVVIVSSVAFAGNFRARASTSDAVVTDEDIRSDVEAEIKMGREIAARILGRYGVVEDAELVRYVNLVGKSVAINAGRPEIEFRFAILATDTVNAFAAPGGYIFVTKGALNLMSDEAELAGVLAHEVAHITEKHIVNELGIKGTSTSAASGIAALAGGSTDAARVALQTAVDQAVSLLFEKGLKREDEYEADSVGTLYLANTGYDPKALQRYLKKVEALKGDSVSVMNSTHPAFGERLQSLSTLLADAGMNELSYPTVQERFEQNIKQVKK